MSKKRKDNGRKKGTFTKGEVNSIMMFGSGLETTRMTGRRECKNAGSSKRNE